MTKYRRVAYINFQTLFILHECLAYPQKKDSQKYMLSANNRHAKLTINWMFHPRAIHPQSYITLWYESLKLSFDKIFLTMKKHC